jgi:PadR family transcriptional regulator PadR
MLPLTATWHKHIVSVVEVTDNWTTQLRKGLLELCVLNVVGQQRVYGYDIVKQLRQVDALVVAEGTVYPILSRLKRDGLVTSSLEESPEGPARKYYELTKRGRQLLADMNAYWDTLTSGIETLRKEEMRWRRRV